MGGAKQQQHKTRKTTQMKASEMYPSKFLKATDLGGKSHIVKILTVKIESLGQGEEEEQKPVVYFERRDKGLVCNKTNWNTIIELYGDETESWIGKSIKILPMEVAFKGRMTMAIRVSPQAISVAAGTAPGETATTPANDPDLGESDAF